MTNRRMKRKKEWEKRTSQTSSSLFRSFASLVQRVWFLKWAWLVRENVPESSSHALNFAVTKFSVYKQQKGIAIWLSLLHDLRWGTWLSYLSELLFLLQIHPNWNMNNAYMLMCKDKPTYPTKKPISTLLLLGENLFILGLCFFEMLLEQIGIYRLDLNQTDKVTLRISKSDGKSLDGRNTLTHVCGSSIHPTSITSNVLLEFHIRSNFILVNVLSEEWGYCNDLRRLLKFDHVSWLYESCLCVCVSRTWHLPSLVLSIQSTPLQIGTVLRDYPLVLFNKWELHFEFNSLFFFVGGDSHFFEFDQRFEMHVRGLGCFISTGFLSR